jgi:hypothetical protein
LALGLLPLSAVARPTIEISTSSHVMRVKSGAVERRFPVGLGRVLRSRSFEPQRTVWYTGPTASDRAFYISSRRKPAFYGGLPYLRLSPVRLLAGQRDLGYRRAANSRYAIHGPVTPSLIWGAVSAGCVRMRAADLHWLYRLLVTHPSVRVAFTRRAITPAKGGTLPRRLGVLRIGRSVSGRISKRRDHWFAVWLKGGDLLEAQLDHDGSLGIELYGIRGISSVARGQRGLRFRLPVRVKNSGYRFLRIYSRSKRPTGYVLSTRR